MGYTYYFLNFNNFFSILILSYCKREDLNYTKEDTMPYTHLLVEAKNKFNTQLWSSLQQDFDTLEFVDCFNNIGIQYNSFMPVRIKTKPCLAIMKRKHVDKLSSKSSTKSKKAKKPLDVASSAPTVDKYVKTNEIKEKTIKEKDSKQKVKKPKKSAKLVQINENELDSVAADFAEYQNDEAAVSEQQKDNAIKSTLSQAMSLEDDSDDAIVSTVESYEDWPFENEQEDNDEQTEEEVVASMENEDAASMENEEAADEDITQETQEYSEEKETEKPKEINFEELRSLALGQVNRKTRATKLKIRKIIEQHFRSKGRQIENDISRETSKINSSKMSARQSVKAIIKQERIKEMIEQIATMDLTKVCDLENVSTKNCLKMVIDKLDGEEQEEL